MSITLDGITITGGVTLGNAIVPVPAGLVMNLDAGNTSSYSGSGSTWTDLSGNGNNGTISADGVTFVSNSAASYFNFNGSTGYVGLPINSGFNTPSVTFDVWCNLQNRSARHIVMVNWTGNSLEVNADGSVVMYNNSVSGQVGATTAAGAVAWNTWVNLIGMYNSNTGYLYTYVNGVLKASTAVPATAYSVSVHKISGTDYSGPVLGWVSVARHYNTALTDVQVYQNFSSIKSRYGL